MKGGVLPSTTENLHTTYIQLSIYVIPSYVSFYIYDSTNRISSSTVELALGKMIYKNSQSKQFKPLLFKANCH